MSPTQFRALLARQQLLNQRQRKRLARKVHDDISQKLTLLSLQLSLAETEDDPPENWAATCKEWAGLVMELGQTVREIINELQPRTLDESGLAAALRSFAQSSPGAIRCTFIPPNENISLQPFAANELLGICREIVTEILAPDGAARVEIELEQKEGTVHLHLRTTTNEPGRGLITEKALDAIAAHERLLCLEGTTELKQSANAGSVVTLSVPVNP